MSWIATTTIRWRLLWTIYPVILVYIGEFFWWPATIWPWMTFKRKTGISRKLLSVMYWDIYFQNQGFPGYTMVAKTLHLVSFFECAFESESEYHSTWCTSVSLSFLKRPTMCACLVGLDIIAWSKSGTYMWKLIFFGQLIQRVHIISTLMWCSSSCLLSWASLYQFSSELV